MAIYNTYTESPIGWIWLQADDTSLCRANWVPAPGSHDDKEKSAVLKNAIKQLKEYFSGDRKEFDLPLRQEGTPFQKKVWSELEKIPYGQRITYAQLAERIGQPKACRAVGSANGKNNIFIIVPCHRVLQAGGKTGGFAYGTEMKQYLLDLEADKK